MIERVEATVFHNYYNIVYIYFTDYVQLTKSQWWWFGIQHILLWMANFLSYRK